MKRFAAGDEKIAEDALGALEPLLSAEAVVLEVAAGTGQRAALLAAGLPSRTWIPSEGDDALVESIAEWRREAALPNLRAPLRLDVRDATWEIPAVEAVVALGPPAAWATRVAIVNGAAKVLPTRGLLVVWGDASDELAQLAKRRGFEAVAPGTFRKR